jgi:[ribosomal protein S18]-alanine N-acetyltransferase
MSSDWLIRRALPADLDDLLAIAQAAAEAPHWSHAQWLDALAPDPATSPNRACFVAEGATSLLGFAVASKAANLAELESVAVSPSECRRGIGKALCLRVMAWSRNAGAAELELEVRASSAGALALYRSLGFRE